MLFSIGINVPKRSNHSTNSIVCKGISSVRSTLKGQNSLLIYRCLGAILGSQRAPAEETDMTQRARRGLEKVDGGGCNTIV